MHHSDRGVITADRSDRRRIDTRSGGGLLHHEQRRSERWSEGWFGRQKEATGASASWSETAQAEEEKLS